MAGKMRFPLRMKNGTEVKTLDELRENFDPESVLEYFMDGRLLTWLVDRYYDDKAEAASALNADMPDLNAKLCHILEVEYRPEDNASDLGYIQRRNEKFRIIRAFTDDKDILNNIDLVALDQEDLFDILGKNPEKVYLYGERFSIPSGIENICYIGINKPLIILDRGMDFYEEENITFENFCDIDENCEEEDYVKTVEWFRKAAEQDCSDAQYNLGIMYENGFGVIQNDTIAIEWYKKAAANGDEGAKSNLKSRGIYVW